MKAADYSRKIAIIDAKAKVLQAQRAELVHKRATAKEAPPKKRPVPKAPSKKKAAAKSK